MAFELYTKYIYINDKKIDQYNKNLEKLILGITDEEADFIERTIEKTEAKIAQGAEIAVRMHDFSGSETPDNDNNR